MALTDYLLTDINAAETPSKRDHKIWELCSERTEANYRRTEVGRCHSSYASVMDEKSEGNWLFAEILTAQP